MMARPVKRTSYEVITSYEVNGRVDTSVKIKKYVADNSTAYTSEVFQKYLGDNNQTMKHSRVSGYH